MPDTKEESTTNNSRLKANFTVQVFIQNFVESSSKPSQILGIRYNIKQPTCFLESLIIDNLLITFKLMHFLKRKRQGGYGVRALKIDIGKAYDNVE